MTLVSIVTPSYNQAAYIREALDSVRAQTHAPIEHVVVDGGSTDGTQSILAEYDDVRWISEPDRGQSHALNKGFELTQGEIIGWLNADDAYAPYAVEHGVAEIRRTGAALVYADVTRVNDGGVNPRRIRSRPTFDLWTELNLGCGIYSPAVFFTRAALEAVGGIDESLHLTMDYDLWLRIGKRYPVEHVDEVWATQRIHPLAKTKTYDFWPERLKVSRRHGGRLVSPLLIRRYVGSPAAQRVVGRIVSAGYAAIGRRPG
jgi:glycosyltransferase involved in cell wall biosynthesis